jgi:hypothetical protein
LHKRATSHGCNGGDTLAERSVPSEADAGREAAQRLYREGLKVQIEDPLTPEFARAAVAEFSRLQRENTPGIYLEALAAAEEGAEDLNIDEYHGVIEVVQNADDAGARGLRIAVRSQPGGRDLLFVHDGEAVRLPDLVAMALAFLSTKRDDPYAKGRFGIGLKTLKRLGDTLTVHCGPYHAAIASSALSPAAEARAIPGLYHPERGETLLELRLKPAFSTSDFKAWLSRRDVSSMLFLDSLRLITLVTLRTRKAAVSLQLEEKRLPARILRVGRHTLSCSELILRDVRTDRVWHRYTADRPVPPSAPKRRNKRTGATTPLSIAIPDVPQEPGSAFAGLPLETSLGMPAILGAQFDVDTPRTGLQPNPWNQWLVERLGELALAVVETRFGEKPATGWAAVPLREEVESLSDSWLRELLASATKRIHRRLASLELVFGEDNPRRLRDISYEAHSLERIVGADDLRVLHPEMTPLPWPARDRQGRWRRVLDESEHANEVDVGDALRLLDDDYTAERPVSWFIRFGRAAVTAGEGNGLAWKRAIILADGSRVVPPHPDFEAEVLVRKARPRSLAARLGLARVIHPAYLTSNPDAVVVRKWLDEHGMLAEDVGDAAALRALAKRGDDGGLEPIPVEDDDLKRLRDAFVTLDPDDQDEVGARLGRAIGVKGFRWERGKRVRMTVPLGLAYLPRHLDDRPEGWAKAAAKTPGLLWIEAKYADVLKRTSRGRKRPAGLAFLRRVGAEVAPRLEEPEDFDSRYGDLASPIEWSKLAESQRARLSGHHATHFRGDRLSPDLIRVVEDIGRDRSRRRRQERARALIKTLDREWDRLYADHDETAAVYADWSWRRTTTVSASWLAAAAERQWMSTEAGAPAAPNELIVRTPQTEALYGRVAPNFAADVTPDMAASPAVRALGITTDPQVSRVVEELADLREQGSAADPAATEVRYIALAAAVTNADPDPDSLVGDLSVRRLRARFGNERTKEGLILVDRQWLRPRDVLRGRPIFGARRRFVPDRSHADRLWRVLNVRTPTVTDCVMVLREIARSKRESHEDKQVLLNTYVYLDQALGEGRRNRKEVQALGSLPVWIGRAWRSTRPIYVIEDLSIAQELGSTLPIWDPPVNPRSVRRLVDHLGLTWIEDEDFAYEPKEAERVGGATYRAQFEAAVRNLADWLARNDPDLSESLTATWDEFEAAELVVAPGLNLSLGLDGRRALRVPAQTHLSRHPLRLSFSNPDKLGEVDAGGRVVATLFAGGDRTKAALAWATAWTAAERGEYGEGFRFAEDSDSEASLDALYEQAAQTGQPLSQKPKTTRATAVQPTTPRTTSAPVRRLKNVDDLVVISVTRPEGDGGSAKRPRRRGLRDDLPPGTPVGSTPPSPPSAPAAYSPQQQEHQAILALHKAINGELSGLRDFRRFQGVGADALDDLKRHFEIKSFARTMPPTVKLTANEFERALREGAKYYLAVVAGLEEGYETVVRIIADPVNTLQPQASTTVVLGGLENIKRPIEVRFGSQSAE